MKKYSNSLNIYENKLFEIFVNKEIKPLAALVFMKKITRYIVICIIFSLYKNKLHSISIDEFINVFDYYLYNNKNYNIKVL